jgi:hypothetical protein
MGVDMAVKCFPVLIQGLANHLAGALGRFDFTLFCYFLSQGFNGWQMFGSSPAPGNILQESQDVLGPTPASGVGQLTGVNSGTQFVDKITDGTYFIGHFSYLLRMQRKNFFHHSLNLLSDDATLGQSSKRSNVRCSSVYFQSDPTLAIGGDVDQSKSATNLACLSRVVLLFVLGCPK